MTSRSTGLLLLRECWRLSARIDRMRKRIAALERDRRRIDWAAVGLRRRAVLDSLAMQMHHDYFHQGQPLATVAHRHGRSPGSVRNLFDTRGLAIRPDPRGGAARLPDGRVAPGRKHTPAEIDALIVGATSLGVPDPLKREWRGWDSARRVDFIHRLRERLALPGQRPTTPFSSNVMPFEYGTPEAVAIADRMNAGRTSRTALVKIDIRSQGVIWDGKLWFWGKKNGYERGPWTPERGRPLLHHVMWEQAQGRAVPPHHVLRFADGNRNNLTVGNLNLVHRGEYVLENRDNARLKRARTTRFFQMTAAAAAIADAPV